jgi:hypothetical protein
VVALSVNQSLRITVWAMSSSATTDIVPAKHKAGRPKSYIDLQRVHDLAEQGMSVNFIAARIGVSERALWNRMETDSAVRSAFDSGIAKAVDVASGLVMEKIKSGDHFCAMWFLRNRAKWSVSASAELTITVRNDAPALTITSHVMDMAAEHSRLLDSPDIDAVEAEFSEVDSFNLEEALR